MITRRTKIQLLVFVIITLLGVTFVGARYAKLDKAVRDTDYEVTAHFGEAGGIFAGAEVTYRGVGIGTVDRLELTEEGVDVVLQIDNKWDDIPADSLAVVGNRSAVGEQYVEVQPQVDRGDGVPLLEEGTEIALANTRTPIQTEELLANLSTTAASVDQEALRTTVDELGKAFSGTGEDLQRIIDTGNSFIEAADANFDITTKLIEDSNVVLNTQVDSASNLRNFADQLALFSGTLASDQTDGDLRSVIDEGSVAADDLRTFIEDNRVELGSLFNNLVTSGEVVVKHLNGIKHILTIYPHVVEGGFTVVAKSPETGLFDAHFGMIISSTMPCYRGYETTDRRTPNERFTDPGMNEAARCTEPPTMSNPRGSQNLPPRAATGYQPADLYFDPATGEVTWPDESEGSDAAEGSEVADVTSLSAWGTGGTVAPRSLGEESWKWLYLEPMTGQ